MTDDKEQRVGADEETTDVKDAVEEQEPSQPDEEIKRVPATLDMLKKKKPVEETVRISMPDDSGEMVEAEITFRSIGRKAFEDLKAEHPPTAKQKKERNLAFDPESFAPALIAATCAQPAMTYEDAKDIWDSDEWNDAELAKLYETARFVCQKGHDIPTNGSGYDETAISLPNLLSALREASPTPSS